MKSRGTAYTFLVAMHPHALNWNPRVESLIEAHDGKIAAGPEVPWTAVAIVLVGLAFAAAVVAITVRH